MDNGRLEDLKGSAHPQHRALALGCRPRPLGLPAEEGDQRRHGRPGIDRPCPGGCVAVL